MIPNNIYAGRMQELRDNYFDPARAEVGDRVPYRDEEDETDDLTWDEAERNLLARGMCLHDDGWGDGYVVAWRYAVDGNYLVNPVCGDRPATA